MKTILVPVGGHRSDQAVLKMAHAVGSILGAHLDFVHVQIDIEDAIAFTHHIDFAEGTGLQLARRKLKSERQENARAARQHVDDLCRNHEIRERVTASSSAGWRTLDDEQPSQFITLARRHDLVIMGRSSRPSGWSRELIERVLLECGRPILLVPGGWNATPLRTIAVWWKDEAASAQAVTAAMQLFDKAEYVSFLSVDEGEGCPLEPGSALARQLGRHGIETDAREISRCKRSIVDRLWRTSQGADLIVMGALGHSRMRELIFGSCTRSVLDAGELPVLMVPDADNRGATSTSRESQKAC